MNIIYNIQSLYNGFYYWFFIKSNKKPIRKIKYFYSNTNLFNIFGIQLFFKKPTKIIGNIYVGNIYNAANYAVIKDYNFSYIINISNDIPKYFESDPKIKYFNSNLNYSLDLIYEILDFIIEAESIIDHKSTFCSNILIHSEAGTNRAAIIIIKYLIYKYNFTFDDAVIYSAKYIPNFNIDKYNYMMIKN